MKPYETTYDWDHRMKVFNVNVGLDYLIRMVLDLGHLVVEATLIES